MKGKGYGAVLCGPISIKTALGEKVMNTLSNFLRLSPFALIFLVSLGIEIILFRNIRQKQAKNSFLKENGARISGSIVKCHEKARTAEITFTYETEGKKYNQVQCVFKEICNTVSIGEKVIICYDIQNPEKSILKDIDISYIETYPITVLFLFLLMYVLMVIIILVIALIIAFLPS